MLQIDPYWTTGSINMEIGDDVVAILVRTDESVRRADEQTNLGG
jgi:hypothetical protein